MQLLPSHYPPSSSRGVPKVPSTPKSNAGVVRLGDVWDEGEELFGIGDDSDEEEGSSHGHAPASKPSTPKIVVTDAES